MCLSFWKRSTPLQTYGDNHYQGLHSEQERLKNKPYSLHGREAHTGFSLALPALGELHTPAGPASFLQGKSEKRVMVGVQGDSARPSALLGGQGGSCSSLICSLIDPQKRRQLSTQGLFQGEAIWGDHGRNQWQEHIGDGEGTMGNQCFHSIGCCLMTPVIHGSH